MVLGDQELWDCIEIVGLVEVGGPSLAKEVYESGGERAHS